MRKRLSKAAPFMPLTNRERGETAVHSDGLIHSRLGPVESAVLKRLPNSDARPCPLAVRLAFPKETEDGR
jgi:hypothetical protein